MAIIKFFFVLAALGLVSCHPDGFRAPNNNNVDIEEVPFVASVHIGGGDYNGSLICGAVIINENYVLTIASCLDRKAPNNNNVDIEEVPFVASVHIGGGDYNGSLICGAVIINENYVLTIASCLDRKNNPSGKFTVVVGTTSVGDSDGTVYAIDEVIVHENYNDKETDEYNVALLKLATPITFTDRVKPATLPDADLNPEEDTLLTITGWFYDIAEDSQNNNNKTLRFLQEQVAFFDEPTCVRICAPDKDVHITLHSLCAGFFCQDSAATHGSALTYNNQLVGVKSVFYGCKKAAAVYVNVWSFKNWIEYYVINQ